MLEGFSSECVWAGPVLGIKEKKRWKFAGVPLVVFGAVFLFSELGYNITLCESI